MKDVAWQQSTSSPKHVELILEINKFVIVVSSWSFYIIYLHWWCTVKHKSNLVYFYIWFSLHDTWIRKIEASNHSKSKGIPWQAEVSLGVPGRLRPRIFSTFGATRVVGRQPKTSASFTPGEVPGTHFQRLSRPQGTWFLSEGTTEKVPSDTNGDWSRYRPTSSAAP